jgi:putative membrane protein
MKMMFLFPIAIGLIIYFFFYKKDGIKFPNSNSSKEKLKEKYINGEIDEETYLKMKKIIDD